jgi:hypothetical protein
MNTEKLKKSIKDKKAAEGKKILKHESERTEQTRKV